MKNLTVKGLSYQSNERAGEIEDTEEEEKPVELTDEERAKAKAELEKRMRRYSCPYCGGVMSFDAYREHKVFGCPYSGF